MTATTTTITPPRPTSASCGRALVLPSNAVSSPSRGGVGPGDRTRRTGSSAGGSSMPWTPRTIARRPPTPPARRWWPRPRRARRRARRPSGPSKRRPSRRRSGRRTPAARAPPRWPRRGRMRSRHQCGPARLRPVALSPTSRRQDVDVWHHAVASVGLDARPPRATCAAPHRHAHPPDHQRRTVIRITSGTGKPRTRAQPSSLAGLPALHRGRWSHCIQGDVAGAGREFFATGVTVVGSPRCRISASRPQPLLPRRRVERMTSLPRLPRGRRDSPAPPTSPT